MAPDRPSRDFSRLNVLGVHLLSTAHSSTTPAWRGRLRHMSDGVASVSCRGFRRVRGGGGSVRRWAPPGLWPYAATEGQPGEKMFTQAYQRGWEPGHYGKQTEPVPVDTDP